MSDINLTTANKIFEKLDGIKDELAEVKLLVVETDSKMKERQANDIAKIRSELGDFKIATIKETTASTTKLGIIYGILMVLLSALIGIAFKNL